MSSIAFNGNGLPVSGRFVDWKCWSKQGIRGQTMRSFMNVIKKLERDEDGASLIEYTVLLAILLVAVIAIIAAVGGWVNNTWSTLNAALP
jgi:pilus assembly protein Flp/PilA